MLRLVLVFGIIIGGIFVASQSAFYGLLFYLWNAYFRPEDWVWDGPLIKSLNLSLLIGIYVVIRTFVQMPSFRVNLRTILLLLFLAQAVVGTVTSERLDQSETFLVDFWKVLLISYFIVVLADNRQKFRKTLVVIALSLGFECAKQGWVRLIVNPGSQNNNPIAFLGDNNGVALGTMMIVPILTALAHTATRRWEAWGYRFVAVGVFMRGFTTYSRGGFLAAGVLGIFMFFRSTRRFRTLVGVTAVAALMWTIMPQAFWNRMNTITASDEERDDSAAGRLHFWSVAVDMANAKPLTGVGLQQFENSYPRYNTNRSYGSRRAAHSVWFAVLGELGYPGLLLLLANLLLGLWSCWRVQRAARRDRAGGELRIYANALMTSLVVFVVAGTFLSEQYNEMFWHFIGLTAALEAVAFSEKRVTAPAVARPVQTATRRLTPSRPMTS